MNNIAHTSLLIYNSLLKRGVLNKIEQRVVELIYESKKGELTANEIVEILKNTPNELKQGTVAGRLSDLSEIHTLKNRSRTPILKYREVVCPVSGNITKAYSLIETDRELMLATKDNLVKRKEKAIQRVKEGVLELFRLKGIHNPTDIQIQAQIQALMLGKGV